VPIPHITLLADHQTIPVFLRNNALDVAKLVNLHELGIGQHSRPHQKPNAASRGAPTQRPHECARPNPSPTPTEVNTREEVRVVGAQYPDKRLAFFVEQDRFWNQADLHGRGTELDPFVCETATVVEASVHVRSVQCGFHVDPKGLAAGFTVGVGRA
jgi:hypothetical protein